MPFTCLKDGLEMLLKTNVVFAEVVGSLFEKKNSKFFYTVSIET